MQTKVFASNLFFKNLNSRIFEWIECNVSVEEIQFSRNIIIVCLNHLRYFVCHGSKVWKLPFWFALKNTEVFSFCLEYFFIKSSECYSFSLSWKSFVPQNVFSFSKSRFALVEAPSKTFLCRINGNHPEMRAHQLPQQPQRSNKDYEQTLCS